MLSVLNSPRFVDKAPPQIYATLLDEGTYLCSISTMYRTAGTEPAGQGPSPAGAPTRPGRSPSCVATGPRQVYTWDITKLAGPVRGPVLRLLRDDRHLLPVHRRRARAHHRDRGAGSRVDDRGLRRPRHTRTAACTPTGARR